MNIYLHLFFYFCNKMLAEKICFNQSAGIIYQSMWTEVQCSLKCTILHISFKLTTSTYQPASLLCSNFDNPLKISRLSFACRFCLSRGTRHKKLWEWESKRVTSCPSSRSGESSTSRSPWGFQ